MTEKKGIELPGLTGRWELIEENQVFKSHVAGVEPVGQVNLKGEGVYVTFRCLPEEMPKLCLGDAVEFFDSFWHRGFVICVYAAFSRITMPPTGIIANVKPEEVWSIRRNGEEIWRRPGRPPRRRVSSNHAPPPVPTMTRDRALDVKEMRVDCQKSYVYISRVCSVTWGLVGQRI